MSRNQEDIANQLAGNQAGVAELRSRLLFVLFALLVYRIGTHIPVPGIDPGQLQALFNQNQGGILELFNMFSGGAWERMSILALGVIPYITASIIMNLLTMMWLGEQITERGVGNGISLLIFSGIVSGFPSAIGQMFEAARLGNINIIALLVMAALAIGVVWFVVRVERGQRRITVNYAKRQQGRRMVQAQSSHLPLKINMAGVIPAIFASSLLLAPASMASWFGSNPGMGALQQIALVLSPGQPLYIMMFAAGIIFFSFFYTAIMFDPKDVADKFEASGCLRAGYSARCPNVEVY